MNNNNNGHCPMQTPSLCLQCARDEMNKNKRIQKLTKFFKNFSSLKNEEGLVLPISSIYRTNTKSISFEEYLESGLIECLLRILKNHVPHDDKFLSKDQNFYLPYYIIEILFKSLNYETSYQIIEKHEGIEIFLYLLSSSGQYSWICSLGILKILNLFNKYHHKGLVNILKKPKEIFSIFKFGLFSNEIVFQRYFQFEGRKNWVQNILKMELKEMNLKKEEYENEQEILNEIVFKKIEMMKLCSFDLLGNLELGLIWFLCDDYFKNFNFFINLCYSTSSLYAFLKLGIHFLKTTAQSMDYLIKYSNEIIPTLKYLIKSNGYDGGIKLKALDIFELCLKNEKSLKIILSKFEFDLLFILFYEQIIEGKKFQKIVSNFTNEQFESTKYLKQLKSFKEFQEKEYKEKILILSNLIEKFNEFNSPQLMKNSAIKDLSKKIKVSKEEELSTFYEKRAETFMKLEEYENAITDISIAILLNPTKISRFQLRSKIFVALKKFTILAWGELEIFNQKIDAKISNEIIDEDKKIVLKKMKIDILNHCQLKFGRIITKNEDDFSSTNFSSNELYPLKVVYKTEKELNLFDDYISKVELSSKDSDVRICAWCDRTQTPKDKKFLLCGGCKSLRYCGKECQLNHWKNGHKSECGKKE
eukprot:gene10594-3112_t